MYIAKVLSNLGAWEKLQREQPQEFRELNEVIANVHFDSSSLKKKSNSIKDSPIQRFNTAFDEALFGLGWQKTERKYGEGSDFGSSHLDGTKNKIGVDVVLGSFAYAESSIFVKFPIFIRSNLIDTAILILPIRSLAKKISPKQIPGFEVTNKRMKEIASFAPRFPFAIIGVSDEPCKLHIEELSSKFDLFLFENIGLTFTELKLQQERHNCDFKIVLPPQSDKVAKEICAFANNDGGGVLLIGVDDNGNKLGFPKADKDELQRRIGNIAKDNCAPSVVISFMTFELEDDLERCVLGVRINEMDRKPCMSQGKIYIRDNATAVPANPEQVRRLLFGSLE